MKTFANKLNGHFLLLLLFPILNLLFMHYQIFATVGIEGYFGKTSILDNFFGILFDVTFFLLLSLFFTWGRIKSSIAITFVITLLIALVNIVYARFFGQYLSLSAIGQAGNLNDDVVMKSIFSEIRLLDLYFILMPILFSIIYRKCHKKKIHNSTFFTLGSIWTVTIIILIASHCIYLFSANFGRAIQSLSPPKAFNSLYPNWVVFHKGVVRTIIIDSIILGNNSLKLTNDQKQEIKAEYTDHSQRPKSSTISSDVKNVIFIIVESYMSVSSDLFVDGKEITPYLNELKRDSNVYYNGHLHPNIEIGKSADGQFIYMSGLLPLHSEITVSRVKKNTLIGLPYLIKKQGLVNHTQILVPTAPNLWEQKSMNPVYGIDKMFSKYDYASKESGVDPSDEEVFNFAEQLDKDLPSPFFNMILTITMHEPFDSYMEHGFHLTDQTLPERYKNYLITCHYFDEQIGKYLDHLKAIGLYDSSLIVIVGDHDAHPKFLDMEGLIKREIPLYIINGGFDKNTAWTGDCNQLDVYTTLLDILGIDSEWRGLGHSLLTTNYSNSVTDKTKELSEWIIKSDYFKELVNSSSN